SRGPAAGRPSRRSTNASSVPRKKATRSTASRVAVSRLTRRARRLLPRGSALGSTLIPAFWSVARPPGNGGSGTRRRGRQAGPDAYPQVGNLLATLGDDHLTRAWRGPHRAIAAASRARLGAVPA